MKPVRMRPRAREDVQATAIFYAKEGGVVLGLRFLEAVERGCARLSQLPLIGARVSVSDTELAGLRVWPLPGFERQLILYIAEDGAVDVLRLVHASQDARSLLSEISEGGAAGTPREAETKKGQGT